MIKQKNSFFTRDSKPLRMEPEKVNDEVFIWTLEGVNKLKNDPSSVMDFAKQSLVKSFPIGGNEMLMMNITMTLEQTCEECRPGSADAICVDEGHLSKRRVDIVFEAKDNSVQVLRLYAVKLMAGLWHENVPTPPSQNSREMQPLMQFENRVISLKKIRLPLFWMKHVSQMQLMMDGSSVDVVVTMHIFDLVAPPDPEKQKENLRKFRLAMLRDLEKEPRDIVLVSSDGEEILAHSCILRANSKQIDKLLMEQHRGGESGKQDKLQRMTVDASATTIHWMYDYFRTGIVSAFKVLPSEAGDEKPLVDDILSLAKTLEVKELFGFFDKTLCWEVNGNKLEYFRKIAERHGLVRIRLYVASYHSEHVWAPVEI